MAGGDAARRTEVRPGPRHRPRCPTPRCCGPRLPRCKFGHESRYDCERPACCRAARGGSDANDRRHSSMRMRSTALSGSTMPNPSNPTPCSAAPGRGEERAIHLGRSHNGLGPDATVKQTLDPDDVFNPGGCSGTCDLRPACRYHSHMSVTATTPPKSALPVVPTPEANGHATAQARTSTTSWSSTASTAACAPPVARPTSRPANEDDSPRGRIYLMRQVIDGHLALDDDVKRHLDLCLNCRACETACPSGVQYGKLIEPFRVYMDETEPGRQVQSLQRAPALHAVPHLPVPLAQSRSRSPRPGSCSGPASTGWPNRSASPSCLPRSLRPMQDMLPRPEAALRPAARSAGAGGASAARGSRCSSAASPTRSIPRRTYDTARVLQENGCEVWIPRTQGCCGALHYHAAEEPAAREFAGGQLRRLRRDRRRALPERRRDHHQRGRLRGAAQGLRPPDARHAAGRGRGAVATQGPRHQRVPDGTRPGEADAPAAASRRPTTTPATCGTPSRSASSRGSCWK